MVCLLQQTTKITGKGNRTGSRPHDDAGRKTHDDLAQARREDRMKEQIFLQMKEGGKMVAEQDITAFTHEEVMKLVTIQKEIGRTSSIKRILTEEMG